jgi:hypothetical protein
MASGSLPYPFITKRGTLDAFKTVSTSDYASFDYGDVISGCYPLTASLSSDHLQANSTRPRIEALRNTFNYYCPVSPHYVYSSSLGDKSTQEMRLLSIPSIFYGSSLRKGTVSCKFYVTGTLVAELQDEQKNGNMVQVGPVGSLGSGSIAGVALYREGFLVLTGSWSLHPSYTDYFDVTDAATLYSPTWRNFFTTGSSASPDTFVPSSSFGFDFEGTQRIPTLAVLCHADKGEMNHSNNPTYQKYGQDDMIPFSSSLAFRERDNIEIRNLVNVDYVEEEPPFEKMTYITKIGLFDEEKNLIGFAKLATPVRKREIDSYTFKLKLDI